MAQLCDGAARHDEAVAWLERVVDADDPRTADAHLALANALLAASDVDGAIAEDAAAIAILEKRFADDALAPEVADAQWALGLALLKKKDFKHALDALDAATTELDESVGWEHPKSARLCVDRAEASLGLGDRKRAAELYGVAVHLFESALGAEAAETKSAKAKLAALEE